MEDKRERRTSSYVPDSDIALAAPRHKKIRLLVVVETENPFCVSFKDFTRHALQKADYQPLIRLD